MSMFTFWFLLSGIIPLVMAFIRSKYPKIHYVFDFIAIIAFIYTSNMISFSLYNVITDNEMFETTIHSIFLDPSFLLFGGYLILYTTYRLILTLK